MEITENILFVYKTLSDNLLIRKSHTGHENYNSVCIKLKQKTALRL